MDEELPIEDQSSTSSQDSKKISAADTSDETAGGTAETAVGTTEAAVETTEAAVNTGETVTDADESVVESQINDGAEKKDPGRKHTRFVVAGIIAVILLIAAGLFLPPISIIDRLDSESVDEADSTEVSEELAEEIALPGGINLSTEPSDGKVKVQQLDRALFLSGDAGNDWIDASNAAPNNLTFVSDIYTFDYDDEPPQGAAEIDIPAEAQPYQTMDLYGWDGENWTFIASTLNSKDSILTSAKISLPLAMALMQTLAPDIVEVGAEVLPTQTLAPALLPYITEITAGTLTLGPAGSLLGEAVSLPTGGYRQLLRATNTGAIIDVASLANTLVDPVIQKENIDQLLSAVQNGEFDGLNLDYQGVPVELKLRFTDFIRALAEKLHADDRDLVVTLETPLLMDGEWDTAGQDWAAIGVIADAVYSQMPLDPTVYGDNQFAEQVLGWATRQIDRRKLTTLNTANAIDSVGDNHREVEQSAALADLGEISFTDGSDQVIPGESVRVTLSGSTTPLTWDPTSLTYKYSYEQADQEHLVWLGSEALLSHRSRFADRYNLRGVGIRGLGDLSSSDGYAQALSSIAGTEEPPQPASAAIVWTVEDEAGGVLASSTGEDITFSWESPQEAGEYLIQARFAQGDMVAVLDSQKVAVGEILAAVEPEETEKPEEETEEATPTPEPTAPASQPSAIDLGDADAAASTPANVRSGPGLAYGIIGGLNTGEKVLLLGRNDETSWLNIELPDGQEGWIFGQLLSVNPSIDVSSLAVVEVDPPIVASGGGGGETTGAPPPVIAPAGGGSFELGAQTHTLANPTLMQAAGMNWVKFQHKWGSSDTPNALAGRIQQAHANGMKVLLSIPGQNAYPSSIDFGGYVEFLRGVAALGPDAIEIWNEMNIDFEWPAGQIDPASYVNNMLAPAYNAIKSANPSVMVISGAPAPTGFDNGTNAWSDARYMAGVAAAGGGNYMDCIGVHHNAGATSPSATSGHPAGGDHYSWYFWPTLNMYYNTFGGARPVCFTELGYLSGQDFGGVPSRFSWAANTSVAQHAQWLAEAASLAANSGKVRMMIIFNVDFTLWSDDPQAGYAMLRPDGSCPSCGPLGQVMGR